MLTAKRGGYYLTEDQVAEMNIVGLSGKKNSGKSTLARYLVEKYGFVPEAMARHLKTQAVAFRGLPIGEVYGSSKSPETRAMLERMGHDESRLVLGNDIWLKAAESNLYFAFESGVRRVVFADIRYPNEADWISRLGGCVYRLEGRGDTTSSSPAEVALDEYDFFDGFLDNAPGQETAVLQALSRYLVFDFSLLQNN